MITIYERGSSTSARQIADLENELGAKLPEAYHRFLLQYNGGRPEPDVVDIECLPGTPTDIQVFFGIDSDVETCDLFWVLRFIATRYPNQNALPVACDSSGNLFCLKVDGDIAVEVVYLDLANSECTFYRVASCFEKFIGKIREFDEQSKLG